MSGFGNWLKATAAEIVMNSGMRFALREVMNGICLFEQTHLPTSLGGGYVPRYDFTVTDGIVSQDQTTQILKVALWSDNLDDLRADYEATLVYTYTLSPESIAAGATFADMTNATAADQSNVTMVNALRAAMHLPALSD